MTALPKPTWFNSDGYLLGTLPADCIADCAHAGPCDDDVKHWREQLEFQVPRERAIAYLREFGAWTPEELAISGRASPELASWTSSTHRCACGNDLRPVFRVPPERYSSVNTC